MPTLTSMLPSAGLFLPETLHRADLPTPALPEGEATRLKYFQRMYGRPKQEPRRNSEDRRPSTVIPRETPDEVMRDFPSIPTTFYFADYVFGSDKASSDTLLFANLIQQVRQSIDEATRLYLSSAVSNFLDAYPSKRTWIEHSLREVRRALNDIGLEMDTTWPHDEDGGTVASKRKFEWGLKNQKRLLKRQQQLSTCHTQLTGAIYVMQTAELCGKSGTIVQEPIFEAPVRPWVQHSEKDVLRGPYSRQRHRASHTNLNASNVTLPSEVEKDVETSSVNSIPVELHGSTPADLESTESQSMRTFLSPQVSREFIAEHSTLFRRQRASSDYVRTPGKRDTRTRASFDTTGPSSKLVDTTIERNDSTMSTTATVSVPMVARRYRATSIDIQRRSLPSELPHLKSQPSLIDDLAEYVLQSAASERVPTKAWATSPTLSVPSISVTSSPTIGHTLPAVYEGASTANRTSSESSSQNDVDNKNTQLPLQTHLSDERPAPLQQQDSTETIAPTKSQEDSASRRASSVGPEHTPLSPGSIVSVTIFTDDEPIQRPSSQRPSQRLAKRTSHASSNKSYIASPSPTIVAIPKPTAPSLSTEKEVVASHDADSTPVSIPPPSPHIPIDEIPPPLPPRPTTNEVSQPVPATPTSPSEELADDDVVLSVLRQRLRSQSNVKKMAEDLVRAKGAGESTPTEAQTPVAATQEQAQAEKEKQKENEFQKEISVRDAASPVPSNGSLLDEERKQMSAQAKRRAAHARRMALAFGDGA